MPVVEINYLAVLVAALLYMAIGFGWYSLRGFGNPWMRALGKKQDELKPNPKIYLLTFFGALIISYILAHFVDYTYAKTFFNGLVTGGWVGIGFTATTLMVVYLFEDRPKELFLIDAGYQIVALALMGGLLAIW